jgi:ParB family chromosome partitioning protein
MNDIEKNKFQKKTGLGKGFNALLGLNQDVAAGQPAFNNTASGATERSEPKTGVMEVDIDLLTPNPHQPRKVFADSELQSLCASIKEDGIIQPILVKRAEDNSRSLIIIAGERRFRAARLAGLDKVPVIIKDRSEEEMLRIALIENIQRADLNVIEEALAYSSLIQEFGLTQEQVAKKVGKDRSTVTNALRMLALPKEIQSDIAEGKMTMGHGRTLLSLADHKQMLRARDLVVKKNLNVRQTEKLCKSFGQPSESDSIAPSKTSSNLEYVTEALRSHLRTKVKISGTAARGKLEIHYFSSEELERILHNIGLKI